MSAVIKVENLSKSYILHHEQREKYATLRDIAAQKAKNIFSNANGKQKLPSTELFWALKDVSFEVPQGDRIGIIGRNGAGKSTLLKILSRITDPTKGKVSIKGRVASLLEVGTGFHPELTGRENIFLNGSILGLSRAEIKSKFDEIVDFAEVEKFLDTPVKRYSSGMYVRLAFAVAAHLEPEILIVDEVLAVGDSVFQKKCIDRMLEVSKKGRTVIFVSHNFSAVEALCKRAILLRDGQLVNDGSVTETIQTYNNTHKNSLLELDLEQISRDRKYAEKIIFKKIIFGSMPFKYGEKIIFKVQLASSEKRKFSDLDFGVNVIDKNQNCIYHCSNRFINKIFSHDNDDDFYQFEIENNLKPGYYSLILFLRTEDMIQDFLINQIGFEITDGNPYGFNDSTQIQGNVFPPFTIAKLKTLVNA